MKIDVCGLPIEVRLRKPHVRDDGNMGNADLKRGIIFIESEMPVEVKKQTLIHEWLHLVYDINGIKHDEHHISIATAELYRNGFRIKVEDDLNKDFE